MNCPKCGKLCFLEEADRMCYACLEVRLKEVEKQLADANETIKSLESVTGEMALGEYMRHYGIHPYD